ncbi:MAG: hypothetical protein FRX48_00676 [Lasallia pustulata]|uniref:Uncharacterized protein n=1 Tax=Lasallia pustulata TaxID=136370 RepID=A0A5M8Q3K4_9LECA|nr:MAG: hypothetical protein FRX48_00676 [Lasallia pustulata]
MSSRAWNICRQRLGTVGLHPSYNKFPTSKADIQPSQGMSSEPIVSHGRGGAANIGPDSTPYADGEIIREGPSATKATAPSPPAKPHLPPPSHSKLTPPQRGGAANIGSPKITDAHPGDETSSRDGVGAAGVPHGARGGHVHVGHADGEGMLGWG